jgi:ABC-type multidrug transport system fused ATPase/permease subunit
MPSGSAYQPLKTGLPAVDVLLCEKAVIHDEIASLPMAYETIIAEGGIDLAGGQRQRLAIARALAHRPTLLILDEATSALDAKSERKVQSSISRLHGSMTVVIVAHRLSTIRDADLVVVLEDGKVKESGSYADLLTSDSTLKSMLKEQGIRS